MASQERWAVKRTCFVTCIVAGGRSNLQLVLDLKYWGRLNGGAWFIFNWVAIERDTLRSFLVCTAPNQLHIIDSYAKHLFEGTLKLRIHEAVYEGVHEAAAEHEVVGK